MADLKDVAKEAGVSTATVSRVLSNPNLVKKETIDTVMKAVKKLNYRPNLTARSLRAQKSNKIGLIVSDIRNPFFAAICRSVEDAAYEQGYSLLICNTDEDPRKEEMYLNLLYDQGVDGIIFSPTHQYSADNESVFKRTPLVIIDRSVKNSTADMVLLDNGAAAYDLTDVLIKGGYTNIAGLFGDASQTGRERSKGFQKALKDAGLKTNVALFIPPRIISGYETTFALLSSSNPPDAIFTSNSMLTAGALKAIRERKLPIPSKIGLVGFDETTWGELAEPPITVIAQPTQEIGKTATELLFQKINDPERSQRTVILKGELRVKSSSSKN